MKNVQRPSRPAIWLVDILLLVDPVLWLAELRVPRPSRTKCRVSMSRPLLAKEKGLHSSLCLPGSAQWAWCLLLQIKRTKCLNSETSNVFAKFFSTNFFSSADPLGCTACEDIWEKAVTYYWADIKNSLWNWVILTFCSVETQPGLSLSWKKSQTQRDLNWQFPNLSEKPPTLLL